MMNRRVLIATLTLSLVGSAARAENEPKLDMVKLTIGQRGAWDTAITYLGSKAGIFAKHGVQLDMTYTAGTGETLQPVISGAVDAGLAVGTMGAMSAFAKGAPVRIIAAEATGAADYWYSRTSSPIRTLKDTNGHTIAYSTRGSSTDSIVRAFITEFGLYGKARCNRQPLRHPGGGDERPGRCRLVVAALRLEGDGGRQDPPGRQGDRRCDRA